MSILQVIFELIDAEIDIWSSVSVDGPSALEGLKRKIEEEFSVQSKDNKEAINESDN